MIDKDKQANYKLKSRYGITLAEYKEILKKQGNKCAICRKPQSKEKKRFAVDHNHRSGFIRGILCNYCNSRLMRYLRDDKQKAKGLIAYLVGAIKNDKSW